MKKRPHTHRTHTDSELVKLALQDSDNFSQIIDRYESRLLLYILRFSALPKTQSEDILQEIFIKIYRNLRSFDHDLKFSSWAYRIAHNETVNYLKKHYKEATIQLESDDEKSVNLIEILKSDIDIHEESLKKELSHKVRQLLLKLKPEYREILVLHFLEGKKYQEISDILRKPMGTIATLMNRAKARFKQLALEAGLNHHLK